MCILQHYSVADPDLELRVGGGGEGGKDLDLLALLTFFPSVISSLAKIIRGGGGGKQGPSPRSATAIILICTTKVMLLV